MAGPAGKGRDKIARPATGSAWPRRRARARLATFYEILCSLWVLSQSLPLKCKLVTGRTHQIRVHLKALNLPIVGDPVYGSPRWKGLKDEALREACKAFPRQALHAWRLGITHPATGEKMSFTAPVPADLAGLLAEAGLPVP